MFVIIVVEELHWYDRNHGNSVPWCIGNSIFLKFTQLRNLNSNGNEVEIS